MTPNSREWKQKRLALLRERDSRCNWRPQHRKSCKDHGACDCPQVVAFNSDAYALGYGGAAGGGKSDLILGKALKQHHRSVIFRRTAKEAGDLYERARVIAGPRWRGNDTEKKLRGPEGQLVEFAGLENPSDVLKWRGRPHDLIAFDEVTEFLMSQVQFVIGWLRTTRPDQRCEIIMTFNPPSTIEGRWVIRFYAPWIDRTYRGTRAMPGELRWFASVDGKEREVASSEPFIEGTNPDGSDRTVKPVSRTFIPALLKDNPILAATDYGDRLNNFPEPLRSQLLYGDFDAGVADDDWQVIPTAWIDAAFERYRKGTRPDVPMSALGLDVARGGKDSTTFAPRYDHWFDPVIKFPGLATPDGFAIARDVAMLERADDGTFGPRHHFDDSTEIHIDIVGVGSSPADILANVGYNVVPINGGAGSSARDRTGRFGFVNKRSEIYWKLREALDPENGDNLAIAPSDELRTQLAAHRWKPQSGNIKVLSKDEVKELIGHSPDEADATVYAHADVAVAKHNGVFEWMRQQAEQQQIRS